MNTILFFGVDFLRLLALANYNKIFASRSQYKYNANGWYIVMFAAILAVVNSIENPFLNLATNILACAVITSRFHFKRLKSILIVSSFLALGILLETIGAIIMMPILEQVDSLQRQFIIFVMLYITVFILLLIIQTLHYYKKHIELKLPARVLFSVAAILALSVLCFLIITTINWKTTDYKLIILSLALVLSITVIDTIILYVLTEINKIQSELATGKLILNDLKAKEDFYLSQEKYLKETNAFRHDLKNKLLTLMGNYPQGDDGYQLLTQMLGEVTALSDTSYCGNAAVNAVFASKLEQAEQYHIDIDYNLLIPQILKLNNGEIGVLFGNLLDNAIDACQLLNDQKKHIEIVTKYENEHLILNIKNTTIGKNSADSLYTTKADKTLHGFGLKSVESVVAKYNGVIDYKVNGNIFEVSAVLYDV